MRIERTPVQPLSDGTKLVCLASGILLLLGRFFPFDRVQLVVCPMKTLTHVPCPACGMTRSFVRFTHMDWLGALHVSPLGSMLAVLATVVALYGLLRLTVLPRGLVLRATPREERVARVVIVGLALANWVYLIVSGAAA